MSHPTSTPRHPLLACADTIEKALAAVLDCDPAYLSPDEKAELLLRLTRLLSQQEALRLRTVAAAGDLAAEHGCRRVADWLAPRTHTDRRTAYAQERLAHALDTRWRQVGAAVADGRMHLDQARVIVTALDGLPADVGVEVTQLAERRLVEDADQFGPADLARLGRRVLDLVAPEVGEDQERRTLERAEQRADALTRLDFTRRGDGSTHIAATVPDAVAARLKTYLDAFTSPRHHHQRDRATPRRTRRPASGCPPTGTAAWRSAPCSNAWTPVGCPTTAVWPPPIMVTIPLGTLQTGLGTAQLGTGEPITAGEARRLACTAGLVPAVLGTRSEVLDLGRTARLFTAAQRKALALRHPRCRAEDCDVPAPWCRPTTPPPGPTGGSTNLTDGVLLCHWHHQRAHDTRYTTTRTPNGDLRYHRRT